LAVCRHFKRAEGHKSDAQKQAVHEVSVQVVQLPASSKSFIYQVSRSIVNLHDLGSAVHFEAQLQWFNARYVDLLRLVLPLLLVVLAGLQSADG
jgi:hypothetical protein